MNSQMGRPIISSAPKPSSAHSIGLTRTTFPCDIDFVAGYRRVREKLVVAQLSITEPVLE